MPYRVLLTPAAEREFLKLPPDVQARIRPHLLALANAPRPPGAKKLAGKENLWRIRVGTYRAIYRIKDREREVLVVKAGHRSSVYG